MFKKTIVHLIESERGWSTTVEEVKEFDTLNEAEEFVKEFNKQYDFTGAVPEYYYIAKIVQIGDK